MINQSLQSELEELKSPSAARPSFSKNQTSGQSAENSSRNQRPTSGQNAYSAMRIGITRTRLKVQCVGI